GAAEVLRNERGKPARFRHGSHEFLGISLLLLAVTPVIGSKLCAQLANGRADLFLGVGVIEVHVCLPVREWPDLNASSANDSGFPRPLGVSRLITEIGEDGISIGSACRWGPHCLTALAVRLQWQRDNAMLRRPFDGKVGNDFGDLDVLV